MANILYELVFTVATLVILFFLLLVISIPFFVLYSQNFLMYRNRFQINTNLYQTFWRKLSFYDSIFLTYRLYVLQEMSN
jgi:hypothetical protein